MINKYSVIAVLTAAVMAFSAAAVLTGCGGSSSQANSSSSAADTTAAALTNVEPTNGGGNDNGYAAEKQSGDQQATGEEQGQGTQEDVDYTIDDDIAADEKHGDITSSQAVQITLQNFENGIDVTLVEHAEYSDEDCWHVVVKDTAGKYINCYVSSVIFESIPQDDPQDPYADVEGYYDFGGGGGADRAEP